MKAHVGGESGLRQASSVLYIAVDDLLDARGALVARFEHFAYALEDAGIPAVWLSARTRMQLDEPRRKLGHAHPFIAEDGCGVYLPQDYFHLRPQAPSHGPGVGKQTVRLGRFTCLPIAERQPAAADALESLAADSGVAVVTLRSLTPRELAQNLGLHQREAELARQRDFDEPFFFAGAASDEIQRVRELAHARDCQIRDRGVLHSLAVRASLSRCVRELSALYDRALHGHARRISVTLNGGNEQLARECDRSVVLTGVPAAGAKAQTGGHRVIELPLHADDVWEQALNAVVGHR